MARVEFRVHDVDNIGDIGKQYCNLDGLDWQQYICHDIERYECDLDELEQRNQCATASGSASCTHGSGSIGGRATRHRTTS
jgi:hypothetical protein